MNFLVQSQTPEATNLFAMQAEVDKWLSVAATIQQESKAWLDPFASAGDFSEAVGCGLRIITQQLRAYPTWGSVGSLSRNAHVVTNC